MYRYGIYSRAGSSAGGGEKEPSLGVEGGGGRERR